MSRVTDKGIVQAMDVVVTWDDMGYAFAKATSKAQKVFLAALAKHVTHTKPQASWPFQCHAIANEPEWTNRERDLVVERLESLLEHLRESRK